MMQMADRYTILVQDSAFAESPRWHDGSLWWSDMHGHAVYRFIGGRAERVCEVAARPSGLGWLPDGRLLVVSMLDKRVLRIELDGSLTEHADLSQLAPKRCNDMVVDRQGRAYVGNFGFELEAEESPCETVLVCVEPDGRSRVVADRLVFPNGAVIASDGRTFIVAETFAAKLTAFDISANGDLTNRRAWAYLPIGAVPDGICLDSEGAIWVASPSTSECLRISEGGVVLDRITTDQKPYACALGGDGGRTLFVCVADSHDPERQRTERNGRIVAYEVAVSGTQRS